ncbi:hypothetical protein ACFWZU_15630 [Frateuria sp. GZRR33]|uniref:hypothetical protein n=1 Tax=Frateuria sp. GZRR33 TaxID=3351535 RepID=UPI003EDC19F7
MTVFDPTKPHPCERIARIEGQTNFWRLLAGVEESVDTTEDMAALSFARRSGCPPELLEAYWGGSRIHRRELCLMCFRVLDAIGRGIRDKDRVWTLGAIIDGFDRFCGIRRSAKNRAEHFKARREDYLATRKLAEGLFYRWAGFVQPEWIKARYRRGTIYPPSLGNMTSEGANSGSAAAPPAAVLDHPGSARVFARPRKLEAA